MERLHLLVAAITAGMVLAGPAQASVEISEILADPAKELAGDANEDGFRSAAQDEFIELFNNSEKAVNISAWMIQDNKKVRHVFPENTILEPKAYLAVFGGSKSELKHANWQKASSGALGLDNSGDTVILLDGDSKIVDRIEYKTSGAKDQALAVQREGGEKRLELHSSLAETGGALYSPGKPLSEAVIKNVKK